jgi:hypothetical protein
MMTRTTENIKRESTPEQLRIATWSVRGASQMEQELENELGKKKLRGS